ncbi:unnamed protein product [Pleuronectes platessa]|uniref:Uncharacterized protein n=1 Tax=Pleuronectes platessa TaxID=8262 RepID=A0A9N7VFR2_PLEPL|nr:unnamed protein product [Pleuronectes platessa]
MTKISHTPSPYATVSPAEPGEIICEAGAPTLITPAIIFSSVDGVRLRQRGRREVLYKENMLSTYSHGVRERVVIREKRDKGRVEDESLIRRKKRERVEGGRAGVGGGGGGEIDPVPQNESVVNHQRFPLTRSSSKTRR